MPDVRGYKLEKALAILSEYNFEIVIRETFGNKDIKNDNVENKARVIRQKVNNNILQLVIAYF